MDTDFATSLIKCAAVLALKGVVVSLWTVRARIMSKTYNFEEPEGANLMGKLITPAIMTFIPLGGTKRHVEIGERISINNAVNEPMFIALALTAGLATASPPAFFVKNFMYCRVLHNCCFFLMDAIGAAPRTICYVTGMSSVIGISVFLLTQ